MALPDSKSESLVLAHPTPEERTATWTLNKVNWGSALSMADYLERESYLMTVPLAKDGGITHWILVDRNLPPNDRPILASCESLRKPVLVSQNGVVTQEITHGVGSVFSNPKYRGKGYASRLLRELGPVLKTWQTDANTPGMEKCSFSILYSDIGKKFYANIGWAPFPSTHMSFPPEASTNHSSARPLTYDEIPELCTLDEKSVLKELVNAKDGKYHVALLPNYDCMQWHHMREDFVSSKILGKCPTIKGAIAGSPGSRIWALWTRAYYGPIKTDNSNTLHILRLVIEDDRATDQNVANLADILNIAKAEAEEWQLGHVEVWNPTETLKSLVQMTGLEHNEVEREEESIASLMWYGQGKADDIVWVRNEKYGWC